ncbi:hypothetical protein M378DRAFT_773466 [Amanita muscaria Koide BX008]|uniref:Uncharacterized protein n=1 Tax=Amanita muscaria (strain Koide BX008) TaxID=946122 RepID=A0A0C2TPV1_AMAMK|nr:hypothetical protein M378DRAFT_773466 [Amanita muscaria Koide BX008]
MNLDVQAPQPTKTLAKWLQPALPSRPSSTLGIILGRKEKFNLRRINDSFKGTERRKVVKPHLRSQFTHCENSQSTGETRYIDALSDMNRCFVDLLVRLQLLIIEGPIILYATESGIIPFPAKSF